MSDKTRHKILGYLTKPILEHYETGSTIVARSFDEIEKKFDLNKRQVWEQASELLQNKEIVFYSINFQGFMGTDKGLVSFTTEKYLSRKRNNNRESIKFYLGVFIPVVSLLIALITVLHKIDNIDMKSKNSIEKLEKKINQLEKKAGNTIYNK